MVVHTCNPIPSGSKENKELKANLGKARETTSETKKRAGDMVQLVEYLPSMYQA
jgi:hypothetical protein